MAELVDAADLKSADGNVVGVQVPLLPYPAAGFWQYRSGRVTCQGGERMDQVDAVTAVVLAAVLLLALVITARS